MDRRNKQKNKKNTQTTPQQQQQEPSKRPLLSQQKRNELRTLVASLVELTTKQVSNPNEEWQLFVDIRKLLDRVVTLEAPLRKASSTAPSDRLAQIEKFYAWSKENGIKYDGLRIAQFNGYDLGLEATRDIVKDEQLFSIPRKVILSEENLDNEFKNTQFRTMTNLTLAYVLMLESMKPDSFWKPYLDLLPSSYTTVLYFSIEDMEQLRGSNALPQALRQCRAIARQYAYIYKCSQEAPVTKELTQLGRIFKEQFSYELYRWAVSTVMTRENLIPRSQSAADAVNASAQDAPAGADKPIETIAVLIPFWDMANHRHGSLSSFYNMATSEMESTAQTDFKCGEQVFIHYGERSNADLMIHNGFIDPANPRDSVVIKLGLSASDALCDKRAQLLQQLKIPKISELKVLPPPNFISPELLAFVRIFNMNEAQLDHWTASGRGMDLLHIDCALETSLEAKTWQYVQTRLMLLLRVFPTSLADDEAQLAVQKADGEATKTLSYTRAMLLEYRVLEKRVLLAALDYAKQRIKA